MADKQLIVAVEGTAAMGPFWSIIVSDYLEKIIRCYCGNETSGQKPPTSSAELSLVTFNSHGSYSACLVQRCGWTRDVDIFLQWLSAIPFAGGGFNDAAIAEGLSEALMMFPIAPNGNQTQPNIDGQRNCILIAASNPHPLPTPVYRPQIQNLEQTENIDAQNESRLSDAETVAKSFPQCSVSLSVICPKQLPKLRSIYNAGKRNSRAADPPVDNIKNPHFLVLISENFMEARAALSRPGATSLPSNQTPVKVDIASVTSVTGPPPASIPSVNGSITNRPPISVGNLPTATVKVEPSTITSMANGSAFPHITSVPRPSSQGVPSMQTSSPSTTTQDMTTNSENAQDLKPNVSVTTQSARSAPPAAANVNILNNLSQARQVMNSAALSGGTSIGLPSISQTSVAMHMSSMISSGMTSSVPAAQTVFSSGQPGVSSITGSGNLTGTTQITPNSGLGSFTSATSNMPGNSNLGGISQPMGNLHAGVSISQSAMSGLGANPNTMSGSGAQMVQSGMGANPNTMSGLGASGVSSGSNTMIPTPGMSQQVQSGMQPLGANNNSAANLPLSQQTAGGLQPAQSKYVKVWEGNLSGQRQGQPVFITRLEGYRSASASETLAAPALHHSAGIGNNELMEYLLSKGAEVDSQSDAGTPLIWAAGHGQQDALKVLLEHHANPNAETEDGVTPLLSAVAASSLACLELLVQAGADVNVAAGGATPLHIAADIGSPEILNCLLEAGANPNVTDEDGQKPIQVAAARGNRAAVEILFPLTTKVKSISEWTVDGILEHMQSEANKVEETQKVKEVDASGDTETLKRDLPEVSPEAKERAAETKSRGDDAFKRNEYLTAVNDYAQAIDLDPTNAAVLSNRSLCWIRLGQPDQALADAKACIKLKPDWPKAWYREGAALRLLQRFDEAANSFYEGVKLDPENTELVKSFREAVDAGRKFHGTDQGKP